MEITSYILGRKSSGGGGSEFDWSAIGYEGTPQSIKDAYNYALEIKNNWDSSTTSMRQMFQRNGNLVIMPYIDTSNVTDMYYAFESSSLKELPSLNTSNVTTMRSAFYKCEFKKIPYMDTSNVKEFTQAFCANSILTDVPILNTSNMTSMTNAFQNCPNLSNESLNNIMMMCIGAEQATKYAWDKTLKYVGLTQAQTEICQTLSNYQALLNAGWTTGY